MSLPEYASIPSFVEHLIEDDRVLFTHDDLAGLNESLHVPRGTIRAELEAYGLRLELREPEPRVRGFLSNPHDRFSACPMSGGAAYGNMMVSLYGSKDTFTPNAEKRPQKIVTRRVRGM